MAISKAALRRAKRVAKVYLGKKFTYAKGYGAGYYVGVKQGGKKIYGKRFFKAAEAGYRKARKRKLAGGRFENLASNIGRKKIRMKKKSLRNLMLAFTGGGLVGGLFARGRYKKRLDSDYV